MDPEIDLAKIATTADPLQGGAVPRTVTELGWVMGEAVEPALPEENLDHLDQSPLSFRQVDSDHATLDSEATIPPVSIPTLKDRPDPVSSLVPPVPETPESSEFPAADRSHESDAFQERSQLKQEATPPNDQTELSETSEDEDLDQFPRDPELGVIRVRHPLEDPELGILRIRQQPDIPLATPSAPPPVGFLSARFSAVNSDNILLILNDVGGLTGGTFYRPAATFAVYPTLGPETALIGAVDVGLQRYSDQPSINYNDWRIRLGIRQGLSPRTYGQFNVTYQELFRANSGFRFFDNKSVGLTLGRRDPLTPDLVLDSFYQIQYNDAQSRSQTNSGITATDFSRWSQVAGVYLGYTINPQWHTGLSYQINLIDYTTQDRYDTLQQVLGQLVYSLTPRVRLSLYGGLSFGRSSDPRVRFDDTIFGFTIDATVPLF